MSLCSEPAAVTGHGCGRRLAPALPSLPDRALFLPRLGLDGMKMQVRRGAAAMPRECGEGQGSHPAGHSRRAQGPVLREPKCPRAAGEGQRDPEPPGRLTARRSLGREPCAPGRAASRLLLEGQGAVRLACHAWVLWSVWRQQGLRPPARLPCAAPWVGCHVAGPRPVSAAETLGTVSAGAIRPPGGFTSCRLPGLCGNRASSRVLGHWSSLPGAGAVGGRAAEALGGGRLDVPDSPALAGSRV